MGTDRCSTIILGLWVSLHFLLESSAKEQGLPPPTNITFGMNGMFCLLLQWIPSENTANCSIRYNKTILSVTKKAQEKGVQPNFAADIEKVYINEEITFIVQAECNNTGINSEKTHLVIQLAEGDRNTSVRNFSCIWNYPEYVQCTWQPGPAAPPNVNYTLSYWISEEPCTQVNFANSKQFHDVLPTGSSCSNYTYNSGISNGCRFKFQKLFTTFSKLVIAVSDWSKQVRPYLYYVNANNIAKLKTPVIKHAYRTSHGSINISWNDMEVHKELWYEVLVEKSNSEIQEYYKHITQTFKVVLNAASDVTYTVKVRVRLPKDSTESNYKNFLWSDWSEAWTLQGENSGRNLSILLLLIIPAIIIAASVILLIFMRRLKILIFPRIPDPGKVLSSDLQQWLKNGRIVYNEPGKEEICPVSMLETPLTSPPME